MSEHTLGPWIFKDGSVFVDRMGDDCVALPCSRPGQCEAAELHDWDKYNALYEEESANARLIAAAPDMLEALEQALDDFGDGHCVCEATKQQVRAAIAKATGAA